MTPTFRYFRFSIGKFRPPAGSAAGPPRREDLLVLLFPIVLAAGILSTKHAWDAYNRVAAARRAVHTLKEDFQTRRFGLEDIEEAKSRAQKEQNIPHPRLEDRDAQFIGTHTTVSWSYEADNNGRYVSFEIELIQLRSHSNGPMTRCGIETAQGPTTRTARFIATDPGNRTSRIPANPECELAPGDYAWRVAAVPLGTSVQDGDETKRLSEWSGYVSFALYRSIMSRILDTRRVRVGANLEQDTRFARRRPDGSIEGFEINLAHSLVDCLGVETRDASGHETAPRLILPSSCPGEGKGQEQLPGPFSQSENCTKAVCIEFVPIARWGDWQTALKRKQIDIFIGGATRARQRARSGILFTSGYLRYQTKLYTHPSDGGPGRRTLSAWLTQDRTVGVIGETSNEKLLDWMLLEQQHRPAFAGKMTKQTFSSFPQLEDAMDGGQIDGAMVDETFVDIENWVPVEDLPKAQSEAWKNYRTSFLGQDSEEIAIAVALDEDEDATQSAQQSLYTLLNTALKDPSVKSHIQRLCQSEWKSKRGGGSAFQCEAGQ